MLGHNKASFESLAFALKALRNALEECEQALQDEDSRRTNVPASTVAPMVAITGVVQELSELDLSGLHTVLTLNLRKVAE